MLDIGSAIGPYKVTKKQGEDGMGAIFSAAHEGNDRRVTIKVLHPEYAKVQDLSNRFLNEARAVNRIDHPGVIKVSDFGQLPDGTAYIVMESLRGDSMADRLKQTGGPLPLGTALNYGQQLAATLAIAHEKGIVHRENYIISMVCFHVGHLGKQRRRNKPCPLTEPAAARSALTSH